MNKDKRLLTVTSPLMPDLGEYTSLLAEVWESRQLTNGGIFHARLEAALAAYLGVEHISLYANGTLPLLVALKALGVQGEVITTPYSFVATTHAIWWSGCQPVFADIEATSFGLDPARVEAAITPRTAAIMPVHCYGTPCDVEALRQVAERHGLPLIYDAAHAFGVQRHGESLLQWGDMATLSFHATKVFSTVEGGALVVRSAEMKQRVDRLRNFGYVDETHVAMPGINAKMDELRAAFGLLALRGIDAAIESRRAIAEHYREALAGVPGVRCIADVPGVRHNYAYFPILIDEEQYGCSRDELYARMCSHNVYGRRYFYPLISTFAPYDELPSAAAANLPVATAVSRSIICLPIYHDMTLGDADRVIDCIRQ